MKLINFILAILAFIGLATAGGLHPDDAVPTPRSSADDVDSVVKPPVHYNVPQAPHSSMSKDSIDSDTFDDGVLVPPPIRPCLYCEIAFNACLAKCDDTDASCARSCMCETASQSAQCRSECNYTCLKRREPLEPANEEGSSTHIAEASTRTSDAPSSEASLVDADDQTGLLGPMPPLILCPRCNEIYDSCVKHCGGGRSCKRWCKCDTGQVENCGKCYPEKCGTGRRSRKLRYY